MLPYRATGDPDLDLSGFRDGAVIADNWAWMTNVALATPELLAALDLPADAVPADSALLVDGVHWQELPPTVDELVLLQHDPGAPADAVLGGAEDGESRVLGTIDVRRLGAGPGNTDVGLLVGAGAADELGLVETGRSTLLTLDRAPDQQEAFEAWEAVGDGPSVSLWVGPVFWQTPLGIALLAIAAVLAATLGVAVVAGMTSALAATESDADVRKAVALGAAPSLRRRLHGLQAWWHVVIASVLGSALGLAVAQAFVRSAMAVTEYGPNGEVLSRTMGTITVPWLPVLVWVTVVPVLVGLVIAGVMRSAPVGAPRRRTG